MRTYRPGLPVDEVMAGLRASIRRSDEANVHIVLWLSDVVERRLYRERACYSAQQFVREECGFSVSRTTQMLRLARMASELPAVRKALAGGTVSWTKLRALAPILTRENAARWVDVATRESRRSLERRIVRARERSRELVSVGSGKATQVRIPEGERAGLPTRAAAPGPANGPTKDAAGSKHGAVPPMDEVSGEAADAEATDAADVATAEAPDGTAGETTDAAVEAIDVPVTVALRLDPLAMARLEVLVDALRRQGHRGTRAELILSALEIAVEVGTRTGVRAEAKAGVRPEAPAGTRTGAPSPVHEGAARSRYQVVVAECPRCRARRVAASDRVLDPATANAVGCDHDRVDGAGPACGHPTRGPAPRARPGWAVLPGARVWSHHPARGSSPATTCPRWRERPRQPDHALPRMPSVPPRAGRRGAPRSSRRLAPGCESGTLRRGGFRPRTEVPSSRAKDGRGRCRSDGLTPIEAGPRRAPGRGVYVASSARTVRVSPRRQGHDEIPRTSVPGSRYSHPDHYPILIAGGSSA